MDKIKTELVNSIKEGKWCQITYDNTEKGNTNFWIFILDINPEKKKLKVEMYNHSISEKILNAELKFEKNNFGSSNRIHRSRTLFKSDRKDSKESNCICLVGI